MCVMRWTDSVRVLALVILEEVTRVLYRIYTWFTRVLYRIYTWFTRILYKAAEIDFDFQL